MTSGLQILLTGLIPSVLVILSWLHNNTRLSRLESGLDATNRRLDELVKNFHSDMMGFQASVLEANFQVRERVTKIETKVG